MNRVNTLNQAGRTRAASARLGLGDWLRRVRQRLGGLRRALEVELGHVVSQVHALRSLDDAALDQALANMRSQVRLGRLDASKASCSQLTLMRAEAMALLALAAERSLHWSPRSPQLLAALALHDGLLVELGAGEGKTLAVALAAIMNAWRGRTCHVATANDYLAHRDVELMRPLYRRCGLEVSALAQGTPPEGLAEAYRADVVYAVGKQFLVDFLRDQLMLGGADDPMRMRLRRLSPDARGMKTVMRGLDCLLVDDAETVLLDEAITPVVISVPAENTLLIEAVRGARGMVEQLCVERDYRFLEQQRDVEFTAEGEARLEQFSVLLPPLWRVAARRDDLVRQAIMVRDRLAPQRHYLVQQGRVIIIDDYIGRLLARPAWTQGLHQALELKEGLEPTPPSRVLARMGFAPFFQRYRKLAGIGSGLHAERGELWHDLKLKCVRLPVSAAPALRALPPAIWPDQPSKRAALVAHAMRLHQRGTPVLINLRRLSDAQEIARQLGELGVACRLFSLNQPDGLSETLSQIDQPGQVTLSLNTDLCGADVPSPLQSDAEMVDEDASLHILQFETQELARQDRRILGFGGRRGQAAVVCQYLALDEGLLRFHLPAWCSALLVMTHRHAPGALNIMTFRLYQFAQHRAKIQARRMRQSQPRRAAQLNQQLAFAGEQDMDVGIKQFGTLRKD